MNERANDSSFVTYLIKLNEDRDRGTLAALRSGLGKRAGEAPRMFPHIAKFIPVDTQGGPRVEAVFLTASLFALHRRHDGDKVKSLGDSLRLAVAGKHGETGVGDRLASALDAHPDDLPHHVQGLVGICKSADVPINWYAFHADVRWLLDDYEKARNNVRLRWARDFWGGPSQEAESKTKEDRES